MEVYKWRMGGAMNWKQRCIIQHERVGNNKDGVWLRRKEDKYWSMFNQEKYGFN